MQTHVQKSAQGWKASTELDLDDRKVLRISTYRTIRGGLTTHAAVYSSDGSGFLSHAIGFGAGGDFSRHVAQSNPARATERIVREQHDRVLRDLDDIKREAMQHYAAKQSKEPVHA